MNPGQKQSRATQLNALNMFDYMPRARVFFGIKSICNFFSLSADLTIAQERQSEIITPKRGIKREWLKKNKNKEINHLIVSAINIRD